MERTTLDIFAHLTLCYIIIISFQVGLKFPYRFWDSKIHHADVFGNVPKDSESRGLFNVFYDMSPKV